MLLAHNGVDHNRVQPSQIEHKSKSKIKESQNPAVENHNSQPHTSESNSQPAQTVEVKPIETEPLTQTESITAPAIDNTSESQTLTLIPGWGESILALLILSPFFLSGFKKWLHK